MRRSQRTLFWNRNHKVYQITRKGKIVGWYGLKRQKTAQEMIDEVK